MRVIKEYYDFYDLKENSWSGALQTLEDIESANLEKEFMQVLEQYFCDEIPTDTQVNDFIWFERDIIYNELGLDENGELKTDDDDDEF